MATETITLKLVAVDLMSGNVSKAIGKIDTLAKRGGLMGAVFQGVGQSFGQMLNPLGLVTNAIGSVTGYLDDAWRAAAAEESAIKKLTTAIGENDKAWDGNIAAVEKVIGQRQTLAYSDAEQRESISRLVSVTGDLNQAMRLSRQAMDLARLKQMSLVDASELLGKVYGGNVGILSRYGIQLKKGTTAAEALAELQKRAAGQAEAFADTTAGAMAQLDIALGDLQESIGMRLLPVIKDLTESVLDMMGVLNHNDGTLKSWSEQLVAATNNGQDTTDVLGSLRDGVQALNDILQPQVDEAADFAKAMKDLGGAAGVGERAIMDAFMRAKDGAQLGAEGAKKAVEMQLSALAYQELGIKEAVDGILGRLGPGGELPKGVKGGAREIVAAGLGINRMVTRMPEEFRIAVEGMKARIKEGKEGIVEQFRQLAWQSKHPFAEKRYSTWLAEQNDKATRRMKAAARKGKWGVVAEYRALKDEIMIEMLTLPENLARLQRQINGILSQVYGSVTNAVGNVLNLGGGGSGGVEPRASGGPVRPGGTYLVGENGPELLTMGAGSGHITSNRAMSGPSIVVNVTHIGALSEAEGDRLAAVIEKPLRRRMARAGA